MQCRRCLILAAGVSLVLIAFTFAWGGTSIEDRMKRRLPVLTQLKDQGVIGENSMGFLEYRVPKRPQLNVVNDENNDRRQLYDILAKRQGLSADLVGRKWALKFLEEGDDGQWFQRENGNWYRK